MSKEKIHHLLPKYVAIIQIRSHWGALLQRSFGEALPAIGKFYMVRPPVDEVSKVSARASSFCRPKSASQSDLHVPLHRNISRYEGWMVCGVGLLDAEASSNSITAALAQFDPSPFFINVVIKGVRFRSLNPGQWGRAPQGILHSDGCSATMEAITFSVH